MLWANLDIGTQLKNTVWLTASFQKNSSHNSCLAIIHKSMMLEET